MTYKQAHTIILDHLASAGWTMKRWNPATARPMKVPHATDPTGHKRYYFKTQAIYLAESFTPDGDLTLRGARSVCSDMRPIARNCQAIDAT